MSFKTQYTLANSVTFIMRVQMALVKASIAVSSEPSNTPNHTARKQFSNMALKDPTFYAERMAYAVVTNEAITEDSTDADIEFTVNSMYNALAGS